MTRLELHRRLIELGTAIATGGVSDAYAGAESDNRTRVPR